MPDPSNVAPARLVLSSAGTVLRELRLDRPMVSVGRRARNDVALDDLTVSAEHALIRTRGASSTLHDLDSRNGTLVNGKPVRQCVLRDGDVIEIGAYRLTYSCGRPAQANLHLLSGPSAGQEIALSRPINRIGDTEVAVVARRPEGWVLTHLEGVGVALVNGAPVGPGPQPLADGDLIELAGTMLQFRLGR